MGPEEKEFTSLKGVKVWRVWAMRKAEGHYGDNPYQHGVTIIATTAAHAVKLAEEWSGLQRDTGYDIYKVEVQSKVDNSQ